MTDTVIWAEATWPAASRASARTAWEPSATPARDQTYSYGAVASTARVAPSRRNVTVVTPTSSAAQAETRTVWLTVAPSVGDEIEIVGAVTSAPGGAANRITLSFVVTLWLIEPPPLPPPSESVVA